jgi:hypothetical protein
VFTRRGKLDPSSEVFSILRTCDVGDIRALFLGFKGVDGDFNGEEILLLQVPGYASVLVLGEELDVYLNLVRAVN